MRKLLLASIAVTFAAVGAPVPPLNGGTGVSNLNANTLTLTAPMNFPANSDIQYAYEHSLNYPNVGIYLPNDPSAAFCIYGASGQGVCLTNDEIVAAWNGYYWRSTSDPNWFRLGTGTSNINNTVAQFYSTEKGTVMYPAMTTAQRDAILDIANAPQGLGIFNTDQQTFNIWNKTNSVFENISTLSGASVANNLPKFSNTSGKLIDSGVAASSVALDSAVVHKTSNETIAGVKTFTSTIAGDISGNAATVTNGIYTTGSYADPIWLTSLNASKLSGLVGFANGGLGFNTATLGDLFYASATNTPGKLADAAPGRVLVSGGVGAAPAYSASPTVATMTLNNGGVPLTGTTAAVTFISALASGNYLNVGSGGRNLGVLNGGNLFITNNLDYNALTSQYVYWGSSPATAGAVEVAQGGVFLRHAPIGTAGTNAAMVTDLSTSASTGDVTLPVGNLLLAAAGKGVTIKSAAVSGGIANAAVITGIALVGGTATISDSYVNTSTVCYWSVAAIGGTPGTGYRVEVGSGTVSVTSNSALDTSKGNVACLKGN